jgi:hypothetical protein
MYLVSADPARTRVWKIDGTIVEGHGSTLRRSTLAALVNRLKREADRADAKVERKRQHYTRNR